ncbi:hypothetical protein, partial [Mycobacterium tuberculosis]|uniref:hypothetical protein n=1 Tax=Mycobacterium tuberculosis TaxID=1773 RepID=UPI00254C7CFE
KGKCASGRNAAGRKTQQKKPVVTDGKHREKGCTASDSAADEVVVENNLLANSLSEKRDKLANKVLSGDNSLETAKEFLLLENIDSR